MATSTQLTRAVDSHLVAAKAAGKARRYRGGLAVSVTYVPRAKRLHIELVSGVAFIVPICQIEGLSDAKANIIKTVQLTGGGYGLRWPSLDLDVSVPDLVAGSLGSEAWMSALARRAGKSTSMAKAEAARENGRKGGRPRKQQTAAI